tara:strand:- start:3938 stop:4630 length:693 start_codon:yes stop_codon:yes gene_type:complete
MRLKLFIYLVLCWVIATSANADARSFKVATIESATLFPAIIENIKAAYQQLDISLEITMLPAERAFLEAEKSDVYDAELGRIKAAGDRLTNFIRIPVSLIELGLIAVGSAKIKNIGGPTGIKNLKNYRVASLRGILSSDNLLRDIDNYLIDTPAQGFEMLRYQRIDIFVVPNYLAQGLPNYMNEHNIIIHSPPLLSSKIYHFLHKKHVGLVPVITAALSSATGNPIETLD